VHVIANAFAQDALEKWTLTMAAHLDMHGHHDTTQVMDAKECPNDQLHSQQTFWVWTKTVACPETRHTGMPCT